jgi:hypothetical protein
MYIQKNRKDLAPTFYFSKSRAKDLATPFYFSKSRAKDLATPFLKVYILRNFF